MSGRARSGTETGLVSCERGGSDGGVTEGDVVENGKLDSAN